MGEMMASPSELSLECKPQSYSMLLKSSGDQPAQVPHRPTGSAAPPHTDRHGHPALKLEEYIAGLEAERLKIDAFKRELPLCIELISNAMEASRQQLQSYKSSQSKCPVLEEFIPLKNSNSGGADDQKPAAANHSSDKANWMTTAQLWSCQASNNDHAAKNQPISPKETEISLSVSPNLALDDNNQRNGGGAFLPFTKERNIGTGPAPTIQALSDLALASSDRRMDGNKCSENNGNRGFSGSRSEIEAKAVGNGMAGRSYTDTQTSSTKSADAAAAATTTSASQTHRKQRRCWSPDLHRRFVNALQMLGGSQVATPKQIRELMKVDGLTNDEVKSHLQKYRLHTRRPSPSPQSTGAPAPQLFVLGSIWVPPEYATAAATAHGGAPTIYGTHPTSQVSPHYCNSPVPQEFHHPYSLPQPQSQALHHHHHPVIHQHQQLHVFKAASQQVHSSPDSEGRGGGDRSESIEDGKSESSSWKAESGGENIGGEVRKKLATDEESNGSEITLKF